MTELSRKDKRALAKVWNRIFSNFPKEGLTKQEQEEYNRALAAERNKTSSAIPLGGPMYPTPYRPGQPKSPFFR